MNVTIETERLLIRPVTIEDADAIYKWASDPDVTKYMIYPTHPNVESTRQWLESLDINDEDSYDLGFVYKETGELVGMGGIVYRKEDDRWVIGYNLRKDHWGRGIVPEALYAIIDYVRKHREVKSIVGQFADENTKSKRVMEKLGMHFLKDSEYTKLDGSATFKAKVYIKEY